MEGVLHWEEGGEKSKKWGNRENLTEKGEKETENFESVIGSLKNTLFTRFRTALD